MSEIYINNTDVLISATVNAEEVLVSVAINQGAQGIQGAAGPAGSDASVTNANVNTAIEANTGATRTSLGLATADTPTLAGLNITGGGELRADAAGLVELRATGTNQPVAVRSNGTGGFQVVGSGTGASGFCRIDMMNEAGVRLALVYSEPTSGKMALINERAGGSFIFGTDGGDKMTIFASGGTHLSNAVAVDPGVNNLKVDGRVVAGTYLAKGIVPVASLLSAAFNEGFSIRVSDALAPVLGAAVAGGGSEEVVVVSIGGQWIVDSGVATQIMSAGSVLGRAIGAGTGPAAALTAAQLRANAEITAAAATVLDDTTVAAMVDTLGGGAAAGTGPLVRSNNPTLAGLTVTGNINGGAAERSLNGNGWAVNGYMYFGGGSGIACNPMGVAEFVVGVNARIRFLQTSTNAFIGGGACLSPISGGVRVIDATDSTPRDISLRTLLADKTITAAGTTGAQTINKSSGSVNFAAAAVSLVVTNSLVTTASVIMCAVGTNDTTANGLRVVAAAGSFTLHFLTAPTAETRVNFFFTN